MAKKKTDTERASVVSQNFEAVRRGRVWLIRSTAFTVLYGDIGVLKRNQVVKIVELLELSFQAGMGETAARIKDALQLSTEDLDR